VYYCDDAIAKLQKSIREDHPFQLLITDLYYDEDHHQQKVKDGWELIAEARKLLPDIKIIVFSAEHKSGVIDGLFRDYGINGYVRKARNDSKELKKAVSMIFQGEKYIPLTLKQNVKKLNDYDFSVLDITLLRLLSQGVLMKDLPLFLDEHNLKSYSLSTVEKKLSKLKLSLGVNSNEQLIAFCKDLGVI